MSDTLYQTINTDALHRRALPDRIAPSLYYDPALFEAELERIFYKTWIWVAHESELPNSGDFRTTTIGRQPVIVVRDRPPESGDCAGLAVQKLRRNASSVGAGSPGYTTPS